MMATQSKERQIRRDAIASIADLLARHRNQVLDAPAFRMVTHYNTIVAELQRRSVLRPRGSPSAAAVAPTNGNDRRMYRYLFEVIANVVLEHRNEVIANKDLRFIKQFYSIVAEFQRRSGMRFFAMLQPRPTPDARVSL
jgi:hypothetical protein